MAGELATAVPHGFVGGLVVSLMYRARGCVRRAAVDEPRQFAVKSRAAFFAFLLGISSTAPATARPARAA